MDVSEGGWSGLKKAAVVDRDPCFAKPLFQPRTGLQWTSRYTGTPSSRTDMRNFEVGNLRHWLSSECNEQIFLKWLPESTFSWIGSISAIHKAATR